MVSNFEECTRSTSALLVQVVVGRRAMTILCRIGIGDFGLRASGSMLPLKQSLYRYFRAKVYAIWLHGPLGFGCKDRASQLRG